jgi:hypothetical protein
MSLTDDMSVRRYSSRCGENLPVVSTGSHRRAPRERGEIALRGVRRRFWKHAAAIIETSDRWRADLGVSPIVARLSSRSASAPNVISDCERSGPGIGGPNIGERFVAPEREVEY